MSLRHLILIGYRQNDVDSISLIGQNCAPKITCLFFRAKLPLCCVDQSVFPVCVGEKRPCSEIVFRFFRCSFSGSSSWMLPQQPQKMPGRWWRTNWPKNAKSYSKRSWRSKSFSSFRVNDGEHSFYPVKLKHEICDMLLFYWLHRVIEHFLFPCTGFKPAMGRWSMSKKPRSWSDQRETRCWWASQTWRASTRSWPPPSRRSTTGGSSTAKLEPLTWTQTLSGCICWTYRFCLLYACGNATSSACVNVLYESECIRWSSWSQQI